MTTHQSTTVPPLPGWIVATYVKYRGKRLGPYYSRTWKERGKIKREYVKPYDLARVRAACQAHREKRLAQLECTRNFTRLAGNLNYLDRAAKRADKNSLRPQDYEFLDRIAKDGIEISGRPLLRLRHHPSSCSDVCALEDGGVGPVAAQKDWIKNAIAGFAATHKSGGGGSDDGVHASQSPQHPNTVSPEYPKPQPSAPKRTFMYPSHTKIKKQLLDNFAAALDRPLREKRNAESTEEKFTRWLNDYQYKPPAAPNSVRTLPDSIQRKEIDDFVAECLALRTPLNNHEALFSAIEGME